MEDKIMSTVNKEYYIEKDPLSSEYVELRRY